MFTKICGITRPEEIDWACELGYNAVGFVASAKSKRYCPRETLLSLAAHSKGRILTFCVAHRYDELKDVASQFDVIQLYEPALRSNLAFSSAKPPTIPYEYFFYDASIGSGVFREIPTWVGELPGKVVIAGGLNADNVGTVIRQFRPFGVDVSSSLESPSGIKDFKAMQLFQDAVRQAEDSTRSSVITIRDTKNK